MPRFIIKLANQQDQVFEFPSSEIMIGRGEDCDLILPNVSVSREHAIVRILPSDKTFDKTQSTEIVDLKSGNGITVNNKPVARATLQSRDEVLIGNFSLIYLGDEPEDRIYRERSISYLPKYDHKRKKLVQDATHKLSAREVEALQKEKSLLNNACVIDDENRKTFPESNTITFGGKGKIKVKGFFTGGLVAELNWDGKRHILHKTGWFFVSVKVNGNSIDKYPLKQGDVFQIGASTFTYDLDDGQ